METPTGADRRAHARSSKKFLVKVKADGAEQSGWILNISRGGAVVASRVPHIEGRIVVLAFPESPLGAARDVHAKVVWSKRAQTGSGYEMGVQFVRAPSGASSRAEKRRHPRWQNRILVKYRCVSEGYLLEVDERSGMLENFSKCGVLLSVLRQYPEGTLLELKLPETPIGPARTAWVKIVRLEAADKPGRWIVAGEFVAG